MSLIIEATEKIVRNRPQYVENALWDCEARFSQMSDDGTDSVYADPARRWRKLAFDVKPSGSDSGKNTTDDLNEHDYHMIAAAILWYELDNKC